MTGNAAGRWIIDPFGVDEVCHSCMSKDANLAGVSATPMRGSGSEGKGISLGLRKWIRVPT